LQAGCPKGSFNNNSHIQNTKNEIFITETNKKDKILTTQPTNDQGLKESAMHMFTYLPEVGLLQV